MATTEELLTLLKEHGVEHYEHEALATDCIAFFDGRGWHDCWESVDGEVNVTFSMTPEQAIAATLGRGTCHIVRCGDCTRYHERGQLCDLFAIDEWNAQTFAMVEPDGFCAWGERKEVDE